MVEIIGNARGHLLITSLAGSVRYINSTIFRRFLVSDSKDIGDPNIGLIHFSNG